MCLLFPLWGPQGWRRGIVACSQARALPGRIRASDIRCTGFAPKSQLSNLSQFGVIFVEVDLLLTYHRRS